MIYLIYLFWLLPGARVGDGLPIESTVIGLIGTRPSDSFDLDRVDGTAADIMTAGRQLEPFVGEDSRCRSSTTSSSTAD